MLTRPTRADEGLLLTPAGRAQVERGHARTNAEAAALSLLAPGERSMVVQGLQLYAKAPARKRRRNGIVVRDAVADDAPTIKSIVLTALGEFKVLDRPNPHHDADLEDLVHFYRRPRGAYFVALENARVMGGAGIPPLQGVAGACELRKMYLVHESRGLGLGKLLLERCLAVEFRNQHSAHGGADVQRQVEVKAAVVEAHKLTVPHFLIGELFLDCKCLIGTHHEVVRNGAQLEGEGRGLCHLNDDKRKRATAENQSRLGSGEVVRRAELHACQAQPLEVSEVAHNLITSGTVREWRPRH